MKLLAIFAVFALASCQQLPTVTEDLLAAQAELTIGHEFSEIFLVQNRQRLSDYLERIEIIALNEFMDAYADIKNTGIATREAMEEFTEPSFCFDAIRARWELQVTRYGSRLSQCLGVTHSFFVQFTQILNQLHTESRSYTKIIPNSGIQVLTDIDYREVDHLGQAINNVARDLFFRGQDFRREFEALIDTISLDFEGIIEEYTECYRTLPADFRIESRNDLERIRMCYGD